MNRINQKLKENKKLLSIYFTAGYPNLNDTVTIIQDLEKSGVDMIEIGLPFSDPLADGPTIQSSSTQALKNGMTTEALFSQLKDIRKSVNIPLIIMGYFNPIHKIGAQKFVKKIKSLGVDGLIIVDLPPEEDDELCVHCLSNELNFIRLLTPTSDDNRLPRLLKNTSGFLYYVSIAGVTGTKVPVKESVGKEINRIKEKTDTPICVGFGIKTPEDAKNIAQLADGVVVGSAIIEKINSNFSEKAVFEFIKSLSKAVHLV